MKRKFFNAKFYRNSSATEMIVENGKIAQIGNNLPKCDEEIDLKGKFVLPPYVDPHLHLDYVYTLAEMEGIGAARVRFTRLLRTGPNIRQQ